MDKDHILVQINYFGPMLTEEDVERLSDTERSEDVWSEHTKMLLESFFGFPITVISKEILQRYVAATTNDSHSSIVPHSEDIVDRLLIPLKSAKTNYCLGDYLATIAACGVVGEMLAILVWKMNEISLKGQPITKEQEKGLFGCSFEKLGQEKKLNILKTFGAINVDQYSNLWKIKDSRKPYLHLWSRERLSEETNALEILHITFKLFKEITGIGLADAGSVTLNPLLKKFLNESTEANQEQIL